MLCLKLLIVATLYLGTYVQAAIIEYTWDITYVNANPDGYERRVIGINGAWPCPTIEATVGDTIRIHMANKLDDQTTGIHFHGINQIGTPWQDGPSGVTQCPVPPGSSITYEFLVDAPGTYWYHSHDMGQFPDGFRGPLIVHDPFDPWKDKYEKEYIVTVSDWYKNRSIDLVRSMITPNNSKHAPPGGLVGPDNMLVNDGGSVDYLVEVGKTYRFRFLNIGAIAAFFIHFDSNDMHVIMQDASYVKEEIVNQLRIGPAQRYDLLIKIEKRHAGYNHPFLIAMDFHQNYRAQLQVPGQPVNLTWFNHFNKFNVSGYLVLDPECPKMDQQILPELAPFNEGLFRPHDDEPAWGPVTKEITLNFSLARDSKNLPIMPFNGKAYVPQTVPTLYTAATLGDANTNASVYGQVNPYIFELGDIVQIVLNNDDDGIHPFHLHGHQFQVLDLPAPFTRNWTTEKGTGRGGPPPRKDTVNVEPRSYAILRFKVTQPGVFLFHCHIEWHIEMGITATFIQAPEQLRDIKIPDDHLQVCYAAGVPTRGNAAGNTDPYDQTGFKTQREYPYNGALWPRPSPLQHLARKRIGRARLTQAL